MLKKSMAVLLAAVTVLSLLLTGCSGGDGEAVYTDSVANITGMGYSGLNSRFSGVIVSGSTQKIEKDKDKKILSLNVSVGDSVKAGDVLFSYDVQAVELALAKLELECEQLENSITLLKDDVAKLEKKVASAKGDKKLELEVQLQTAQIDLQEKSFELTTKQHDLERSSDMLENADVVSKVSGVVQTINEEQAGETDENGEIIPYMTIIETGSYRVKGSVSELDVNSLREGTSVIITSRVDDSSWTGSVEYIEWDNPEKNQNQMYYPDSENAASKYPFYVMLDSTDGLLMGQHVYIEADTGAAGGMMLPEYYIVDADSSPFVWAADKRDRLEKRAVELGEYNADLCCYEILGGLTAEDFIAFPDDTLKEGAPVVKYDPSQEMPDEGGVNVEAGYAVEGDVIYDDGVVMDTEVALG